MIRTARVAPYTLFDALERVVADRPNATCVRCGDGAWTFGESRERAVRLGNGWRALGVGRGDRVAVLADNCHRFVEVYLAAACTGAIVVPIESRLAAGEVKDLLDTTRPALLVAGGSGQLERLRQAAPAVPAIAWGSGEPGVLDFDQVVASASPEAEDAQVDEDDPIGLFFTAAVEGRPQGAVVTHRNLIAQAEQTADGLGLGPDDANGMFLPLSHTFGGYLLFVATTRGLATTLLRTFDPAIAARRIADGQVTFFAAFAPMPARIADNLFTTPEPTADGLRAVIGLDGPATIGRYLARGVDWWNFYGQTEVAGLCALGRVVPEAIDAGAVGRPLSLSRVSLRDEAGKVVRPGEAGEAWVRSPTVVERYWPDRPTRVSEGWLHTGDVLRRDAQGVLHFVGRTSDKDLIKPGGLNVYPAEVEAVLVAHPGVRAAWVFGLPDPEWRERICAAVLPADPASPPGKDELQAHCREHVAGFKCPQQVFVVAEAFASRAAARERYCAEK